MRKLNYIFILVISAMSLHAQIGTVEAENGVILGNNSGTEAGTVRWTGSDFEGYDGTKWVSLTLSSLLSDADGDTKIDVEGDGDDDTIFLIAENDTVGILNNQEHLFIGRNAGSRSMTGSFNTGVGREALNSITTGHSNTAIGRSSLNNITESFYNTAIGLSALNSLQSGNYNVAVGGLSAGTLPKGDHNVALGFFSLYSADSVSNCVAIGSESLYSAEGSENIGIGSQALFKLKGGHSNVALGTYAGRTLEGNSSNNVLIGLNAGVGGPAINADAHIKLENVIIGSAAGYFYKGDGSIMLGYNAGYNANKNNTLYIENSAADSSEALIYGEFDIDLLKLNADVKVKKGVTIGNSSEEVAGTMRWTGTAFEGFDGTNWVDMTGSNSILEDADGDTRIDLEGAGDHDEIRLISQGDIVGRINASTVLSLGKSSIPLTSTGLNNTAIGFGTMSSNGTGQKNTAVGHRALNANSNGSQNVALGNDALFNNSSGLQNTVAGDAAALSNEDGDRNTIIGQSALRSNLHGSNNSALGEEALYSSEGSNNTAVGKEAGRNSDNGGVFLGYQAGRNETLDNRLYIENSAVDSTNALIFGNFDHDYLRFNANTEIQTNSTSSVPQLLLTETGADGARIVMENDQNDNSWTIFGRPYNSAGSSQINFHYEDISGGGSQTGNKFRIYGDGDVHSIHGNAATTDGFRLINGGSPSTLWRLWTYTGATKSLRFYSDFSSSSARAWIDRSTGAYSTVSDMRLKENIKNLSGVLDRTMLLSPKMYNYKLQSEEERNSVGFLAQDANELFPELVSYQEDHDIYGINYAGFSVVAIKAIQEQQEIIDELKSDLSDQQKQIGQLIQQNKTIMELLED